MCDEKRSDGRSFAPQPLVSIIIPSYNSMTGTKNIDKTLGSIMDQTYQNIEVLVIDNFSSDATHQVCKNYSIRFFLLNGNRSEARNLGIRRMRGDYALFVDSDHVLTSNVVQDCVSQALCEGADCIVIPVKFMGNRKTRIDCSRMRNLEFGLQLGIQTLILFYSRKLIRTIRFPESVELGEDMIFSSRALKSKPIISRIDSAIHHIEDGSVKSVILRSWNYGKKFESTVSEIGLRNSTSFILDLSALDIRKLARLGRLVSNGSNARARTIFQFLTYVAFKHMSFGMSYCLSLFGGI